MQVDICFAADFGLARSNFIFICLGMNGDIREEMDGLG